MTVFQPSGPYRLGSPCGHRLPPVSQSRITNHKPGPERLPQSGTRGVVSGTILRGFSRVRHRCPGQGFVFRPSTIKASGRGRERLLTNPLLYDNGMILGGQSNGVLERLEARGDLATSGL